MRLYMLAPIFLALAACANEAAPVTAVAVAAPAASAAKSAQVCRRETPVGSNIAVTRCFDPSSDPTRDQVRDDVSRLGGTGAMAAGNGFSKGN